MFTTMFLYSLVIVLAVVPISRATAAQAEADSPLTFWTQQRQGANCANHTVEPEYWAAAAAAGIEFVRLVPDGWDAHHRDFLIGDADAFEGVDAEDLAVLRSVLDNAHDAGLHVVLAFFSLPGARWRQLNGDLDDYRLWNDAAYREQALSFWTQLASELQGHPAIVAYNPLNEPHPEREAGVTEEGFLPWHAEIVGSLADVNRFNREVVQAIRQGDPTTPILLDGGFYASPFGLSQMKPVSDPAVLYAFHYYAPWDYNTFRVNQGRYHYPDTMPPGWTPGSRQEALARVAAWADQHSINLWKIVASEFGVDRRVGGAQAYLDDLLTDLELYGWHWAFYAFRGDGSWGGMDYELGTTPLRGSYWVAVEDGADPEQIKKRAPNPLWQVIAGRLGSR